MATVHFSEKKKLEELRNSFNKKLDKNLTLEEVLRLCVDFSYEHLHEIETQITPEKKSISPERVQEVLDMAEDFDIKTKGSIDADLYGD